MTFAAVYFASFLAFVTFFVVILIIDSIFKAYKRRKLNKDVDELCKAFMKGFENGLHDIKEEKYTKGGDKDA